MGIWCAEEEAECIATDNCACDERMNNPKTTCFLGDAEQPRLEMQDRNEDIDGAIGKEGSTSRCQTVSRENTVLGGTTICALIPAISNPAVHR